MICVFNLKIKEKQVKVLDEEKNVVIVFTDWKNYDVTSGEFKSPWEGGLYPYKDWFTSENLQMKLLSHVNPAAVHLCTSLYRRDSFLQVYNRDSYVFRSREFMMEDLQLIVMLSTVGKFKYLDVPTLAYSIHEVSMTGTKDFIKLFDLYFSSLTLTYYLANKLGVESKELEGTYRRMIHFVTMQAYHARDDERMNKMKKIIKEKGQSLDFKTKIIFLLAENKLIWEVSRKTWQKLRKI